MYPLILNLFYIQGKSLVSSVCNFGAINSELLWAILKRAKGDSSS